MNYMTVADIFDVISVLLLTAVSQNQILDIIYLVLMIISLSMGIIMKIVDAARDKKITKEELEDIKKEVDDAKDQVKNQIDVNNKKEDK